MAVTATEAGQIIESERRLPTTEGRLELAAVIVGGLHWPAALLMKFLTDGHEEPGGRGHSETGQFANLLRIVYYIAANLL